MTPIPHTTFLVWTSLPFQTNSSDNNKSVGMWMTSWPSLYLDQFLVHCSRSVAFNLLLQWMRNWSTSMPYNLPVLKTNSVYWLRSVRINDTDNSVGMWMRSWPWGLHFLNLMGSTSWDDLKTEPLTWHINLASFTNKWGLTFYEFKLLS